MLRIDSIAAQSSESFVVIANCLLFFDVNVVNWNQLNLSFFPSTTGI